MTGRASVLRALTEDLRRAQSLLIEAERTEDAETAAYCAQFLGSVGEMLGDGELADAARGAQDAAGAGRLLDLIDRRLGSGLRQEARGVA